jgi:hypothetical protein
MGDRSSHHQHNQILHNNERLPVWQCGLLALGGYRSCSQCALFLLVLSIPFRLKGLQLKTQDIDLIVSEDSNGIRKELGSEEIKETIVGADGRYFLEPYRRRGATHHILYCRLPGWETDAERSIKLDIVVPPTLGLPKIKESEAILINGIPVMPIFDLLVMKTQGWWDHRTSLRVDSEAKESADLSDICALLERAKEEKVSYVDEADEDRHSQEFMDHVRTLVSIFVSVYDRHEQWRALQFPV